MSWGLSEMGRYLELATTALKDRWARRAAALLSGVADDERRQDLRYVFEERAGILEHDAGLDRGTAEERAFRYIQRLAAEDANRHFPMI
jgi:hypothetical protein